MKKKLTAVILAGGVGNRFWPFASDKLFFPILDKPFIEYSLTQAIPEEVHKIVVIANPVNYQSLAKIKFSRPATTLIQTKPLGMADALITAGREISESSLLIMIADNIVPRILLTQVLENARKSGSFGVLPGFKVTEYFPGGYLKIKGSQVTGIIEKPQPGTEPSDMVNISGHYIEDSEVLLNELSKTTSQDDDVYERALSSLMRHLQFSVVPYEGDAVSLKYPWHVLDVMNYVFAHHFKPGVDKSLVRKQNVIIEGDVYIGKNVKIFENTKIVGPCYIGANTIIGNNNIIRESHIGENCVTGFNTDITRSYVGSDCWFHSNYIGDSVLEQDVSLGSGTVLANLRLDESAIVTPVRDIKVNSHRNKLGTLIGRHARLGVNSSIMPGVKIGENTQIGAGVVVNRDVPSDSFVFSQPAYTVRRNVNPVSPGNRDLFKKKLV